MSVNDDGRGFEPPLTANNFASEGKHGLAGMIKRVGLLDGSHKVESALGKGTSVKVKLAA